MNEPYFTQNLFANRPPLYKRIAARLFGKKVVSSCDGVTITAYAFENYIYITKIEEQS